MKELVATDKAPGAIGPYSQAYKVNGLLYCSGQIPLDPATGELVNDSIESATVRVLENVKGLLEGAGTSMDKVIKTLVFITDMNNFAAMNEIYGKYFVTSPPARSCVGVAALPKGSLVEIEVIAEL